jgi:hypothetical protein
MNKGKIYYKKDIILIIICIIIIIISIILLKKYNKINNIEKYSNMEIYKNIPNLLDGNIITVHKEPDIKLITKKINDKNTMIFPSFFYYPYKNYIGRLFIYDINNNSEIPVFTINNVRLMITNFNTENNYLFYVTLKSIYKKPLIYDLAVMDFDDGNMKFINSKDDLKNTYFLLDENNFFKFNNIQKFDIYPRSNDLPFEGTIESNQDDLYIIKSNKNGKYFIKFDQYVDIQLNNYRNTIKNTNDGLYKNLNIVI